ncbi:MAG: LysM peptidoglycan-binding domain-containing protein, partial [Cyanobacteria bacterium J06636_16]
MNNQPQNTSGNILDPTMTLFDEPISVNFLGEPLSQPPQMILNSEDLFASFGQALDSGISNEAGELNTFRFAQSPLDDEAFITQIPFLNATVEASVRLWQNGSNLLDQTTAAGIELASPIELFFEQATQTLSTSAHEAVANLSDYWQTPDNQLRQTLDDQAQEITGWFNHFVGKIRDSGLIGQVRSRVEDFQSWAEPRIENFLRGLDEYYSAEEGLDIDSIVEEMNAEIVRQNPQDTFVKENETASSYKQNSETRIPFDWQSEAHEDLQVTAQSKQYDDFLSIAFGNNYDVKAAEALRSEFADGNFDALPDIQLISADLINGGRGAFSGKTQEIFIDASLTPELAKATYLEEIGHFIDWRTNVQDAEGDEGAIWARLVQGDGLSDEVLAALQTEDDSTVTDVDGRQLYLEQSSGRSQYTVKSGDTLSEIAQRQLGGAARWTQITKSDGSRFTESEADALQVGQTVYLPGSGKSIGKLSAKDVFNGKLSGGSQSSPRQSGGSQYTVQPGDTLSEIAQRELGSAARWTQITQADGSRFTESEAQGLQIGQTIYLPGSGNGSKSIGKQSFEDASSGPSSGRSQY